MSMLTTFLTVICSVAGIAMTVLGSLMSASSPRELTGGYLVIAGAILLNGVADKILPAFTILLLIGAVRLILVSVTSFAAPGSGLLLIAGIILIHATLINLKAWSKP